MKTSAIALALLVAGSFAAPAFAESFDADYYEAQLRAKGIDVVDAYQGPNDTIRATVQLADGSTVFQYFNEDTLQLIKPAGDTRVLSKLDTQREPATLMNTQPQSLTYSGTDVVY